MEGERLARLIDREFEEWLRIKNKESPEEGDLERIEGLERNIQIYAGRYYALTGEYYHYVKKRIA